MTAERDQLRYKANDGFSMMRTTASKNRENICWSEATANRRRVSTLAFTMET